jgi:hypothetical protein
MEFLKTVLLEEAPEQGCAAGVRVSDLTELFRRWAARDEWLMERSPFEP